MADFEDQIRKAIERTLDQVLAEAGVDALADIDQLEHGAATGTREAIALVVPELVASLKDDAPAMLQQRRATDSTFRDDLAERWGEGFDLLETIIQIAYEAGDAFHRRHQRQAEQDADAAYAVLVHLHARACRLASEALHLLKGGYGQGAMARWRALHEVAVVAQFLADHGHEAATRYLQHEAVESWRAMVDYQDHAGTLGYEPYAADEMRAAEARVDELCRTLGEAFRGPYGWAASILGVERCGLPAIERSVSMDHLRPYYRMASHGVHANPKGITFTPDVLPRQPVMLAGPAFAGLADPGQLTCISLVQVTGTLLVQRLDYSFPLILGAMLELSDKAQDAFAHIEESIEQGTPPPADA